MFFRKHKKLVILLSILLMVIISGVVGFLMAESEPRIVAQEDEAETALPVGADDARITKETVMTWDYVYEMCSHHVTIQTEPDADMIGIGFSALQKKYPDVRIVSFTPEEVVIKRSFSCYCPNHYILKKSGDRLAVFRTEAGKDTLNEYIDIAIKFDGLDADIQESLTAGRVFSTFDDLEDYLAKLSNQNW